MKPLLIGILMMLSLTTKAQPLKQALDSATTARLSIAGFCLCKTTMTELIQTANDFRDVTVEEMDNPPNCYGQDGRFTNGMGIASKKYPGMIFQKGNIGDYVGKIRLTKEFNGKLPDGSPVNLGNLKLKDVFALYPALKDAWGSRDCSDYWHFSDKTISFYVRIDKSIQPQFPINKAHYPDKPVEAIDLVASCYGLLNSSTKTVQLESPEDPVYFVDSIRTNKGFLLHYEATEIAAIQVIKDPEVVKAAGFEGRDGIIHVYTKSYLREQYWKSFRARSAAYRDAVTSPAQAGVVYILNGNVLGNDSESDLHTASTADQLGITIIKARQLKKHYNITGWKRGVVITTSN